jgi:hypothetical protein
VSAAVLTNVTRSPVAAFTTVWPAVAIYSRYARP